MKHIRSTWSWSGQVLNPSRRLPSSLARIKERIWDFQMQLDWSSLIGIVKVNDESNYLIMSVILNQSLFDSLMLFGYWVHEEKAKEFERKVSKGKSLYYINIECDYKVLLY